MKTVGPLSSGPSRRGHRRRPDDRARGSAAHLDRPTCPVRQNDGVAHTHHLDGGDDGVDEGRRLGLRPRGRLPQDERWPLPGLRRRSAFSANVAVALDALAEALPAARAGVRLLARVGGHVDAEAVLEEVALPAHVGPLPRVLLLVALPRGFKPEGGVAEGALVGQLAVAARVRVPNPLHRKHLVTDITLVGSSGPVLGHVDLQALLVEVVIAALQTLDVGVLRRSRSVPPQVEVEALLLQKGLPALEARVRRVAVGQHVLVPRRFRHERLLTDVTFMVNSGHVRGHVRLEVLLLGEALAALRALHAGRFPRSQFHGEAIAAQVASSSGYIGLLGGTGTREAGTQRRPVAERRFRLSS